MGRSVQHRNGSVATDAVLSARLSLVGEGDRQAFADVYRLTSPRLLSICLQILHRRSEAEDALQDAYLTIWQRAERFDPARGTANAWLAVITRNSAIDRRRRRTFPIIVPPFFDPPDPDPIAEEAMIAREEERLLLEGLNTLCPDDAAFLRTAFLTGMSYADLAAREQLPLGTVKSRIRRALLKLRERLQEPCPSIRGLDVSRRAQ